jgi:hypothetical protein
MNVFYKVLVERSWQVRGRSSGSRLFADTVTLAIFNDQAILIDPQEVSARCHTRETNHAQNSEKASCPGLCPHLIFRRKYILAKSAAANYQPLALHVKSKAAAEFSPPRPLIEC